MTFSPILSLSVVRRREAAQHHVATLEPEVSPRAGPDADQLLAREGDLGAQEVRLLQRVDARLWAAAAPVDRDVRPRPALRSKRA
jgi:hypothetical protein